jgi:succinate-acetate transporter protein
MLMKQTLEIINIFSSIDHWQLNRIGGVMDIMLALSAVYRGFEPRVKPKSVKLVFVASPVSTQH